MGAGAASLSSGGVRPVPRLAMAVDTPAQGWVVLPALGTPTTVFPAQEITATVTSLMIPGHPFWQWTSQVSEASNHFTWSIGGTMPDWQGTPLAVVVLLEEDDPVRAAHIGQSLLEAATQP